jgi:uncharacterized protein YjeT (DUF2065 family)
MQKQLRAYRVNIIYRRIEMSSNQIIGLALLVLGVILLFFGYQSSQAADDQIFEALTGRFTDSTMWLFIFGGVSAVVGVGLLAAKR